MEGMTSDQLQRATYKYVKATSERTERIEKTTEATLELAQKIATQEKYQERRPLLEGVVKEIPDEPAKGLTAAAVRDLKLLDYYPKTRISCHQKVRLYWSRTRLIHPPTRAETWSAWLPLVFTVRICSAQSRWHRYRMVVHELAIRSTSTPKAASFLRKYANRYSSIRTARE